MGAERCNRRIVSLSLTINIEHVASLIIHKTPIRLSLKPLLPQTPERRARERNDRRFAVTERNEWGNMRERERERIPECRHNSHYYPQNAIHTSSYREHAQPHRHWHTEQIFSRRFSVQPNAQNQLQTISIRNRFVVSSITRYSINKYTCSVKICQKKQKVWMREFREINNQFSIKFNGFCLTNDGNLIKSVFGVN